MSKPRIRISLRQFRFKVTLILGVALIAISLFFMLAAGTFRDCETLTVGTSICFLFWFNYPLQLSLILLGLLLAFSNRFKAFKSLLSAFGCGALLTYATGLVPFREYSMILDSGNWPCQLLEYGYPLPWLTRIVTCMTTGSMADQLIIPATRFGLDTVIWTTIVGFVFLVAKCRKMQKLTAVLIGLTAILGVSILLLVLGTFS